MIDANGHKFLTMYSIHVNKIGKILFFCEKDDISSFLAALYFVQSLALL
jgi:hypothetical protein